MKDRIAYLNANKFRILEVGSQGPKVLGNRHFIAVVIRELEVAGIPGRNLLQNLGLRADLTILFLVCRDKAHVGQKSLELHAITIWTRRQCGNVSRSSKPTSKALARHKCIGAIPVQNLQAHGDHRPRRIPTKTRSIAIDSDTGRHTLRLTKQRFSQIQSTHKIGTYL